MKNKPKKTSLSKGKTKSIEKNFSSNIDSSRGSFLSEELKKYKDIRVIYD